MTATTTENAPGGNTAPPAPQSPPAPPPAAQTWFTTSEPEVIGHIQTKGWHLLPPDQAALAAAKSHREAEGKLGIAPDRILRRPADGNVDEAKAFWKSLGMPDDPKDYAFDGIDFGDAELTTKFVNTMRTFASENMLPKDMASKVANAAFKFIDDHGKAEDAAATVAQKEEQTKLEADWGKPDSDTFKSNMSIADRMAETLGVPQSVMDKMRDGLGGADVARFFRKLADLTGEARYVNDPHNSRPGGLITREQALERRFQLSGIDSKGHTTGTGDKAWQTKYHDGDVATRKEWNDLLRIIAGE